MSILTVEINDYKLYPSAFIVLDSEGLMTKHYYNGSERVASRLTMAPDNMQKGTEQDTESKINIAALRESILQILAEDLKKEDFPKKIQFLPIDTTGRSSNIAEQQGLYFFHPDHLGTATYLSDANGRPYQLFLNLPFGETMAEQRTGAFENQYKFNDYGIFSFKKTKVEHTAQSPELDQETGFYYYGARYYNPQISAWLSVDPMAEERPGISPYSYVQNNPLNRIDPTGMLDESVQGPDDIIYIGNDGKVSRVEETDDDFNIFVMEETSEVFTFK